jgi:hypothetical protein
MSTTSGPNPAPAPPPKNNALLWILLMLGGVLVVCLVGGLLLAAYIAKGVRVEESGKSVEVSTPVGKIAINKNTTPEIGLPVYPGATALESNGANIEFTTEVGGRLAVAAAHYRATDPLEKVAAWYRQRLGPDFVREVRGAHAHEIEGIHTGDADVAFVSDQDSLVRIVAIKKKLDGVEIGLARAGQQQPQ